MNNVSPSMKVALLAGSSAGVATDITLFPIDSIKTRAQSKGGLWKNGGVRGLFRGVGSAALGSAPSGASFFLAYEVTKHYASSKFGSPVFGHMFAASIAESFACVFRIPFEVVKQTAQAKAGMDSFGSLKFIIQKEGLYGLTRGFTSMIFREIPFTLIQFPLWEYLKTPSSENTPCSPLNSAVCGSIAGGIAATITTPLDVAKTRIILMQNKERHRGNPYKVIYMIGSVEGIAGLFAGIVPRVLWISLGGFVFLGSYEKAKKMLQDNGV